LLNFNFLKKPTRKSICQIENIEWANGGSTCIAMIVSLAISHSHLITIRKNLGDMSVDDLLCVLNNTALWMNKKYG